MASTTSGAKTPIESTKSPTSSNGAKFSEEPKSPTYEEKLEAMFEDRDNPHPIWLADEVRSMHADIASITPKWEKSPHRKAMLDFLAKIAVPADDFQIANALCLGLGTLEDVEDEINGTEAAGPRSEFWVKNGSFFQLLVFETVVNALSEETCLKPRNVLLQDTNTDH